MIDVKLVNKMTDWDPIVVRTKGWPTNRWRDEVMIDLTFRQRVFSLYRTGVSLLSGERFFIYLINKYISLSDICLTMHY